MRSLDDQLRTIFYALPRNGQPSESFGQLGQLASAFHLDYAFWNELVHDGERVSFFDGLETTIFPFDVFEVIFPEAPEIPFHDSEIADRYRTLGYLSAMRYEADKVTFTILDNLEMRQDVKSSRIRRMVSACQYTLIPAKNDAENGAFLFMPIFPAGIPTNKAVMKQLALEEETHTYWLRILMAMIRFARMLNHRGVTIKRCPDPLRPSTRQQRRATGYVDREHHQIVLRPRLSVNQALHDALSGRSTRYTPRHRHPVQEFTRTYASGKIGPVRAHVRGGRLAPGVDYDARAVILAAITSE